MRGGLLSLFVILLLFLGGCMQPWAPPVPQEGVVQIVIRATREAGDTVRPLAIPSKATHVRIRVWHPVAGVDAVRTVALGTAASSTHIHVPEDTGYRVDAVAYYLKNGRALALVGGRANDVTVLAHEITHVQLELHPWVTSVSGTETVRPGEVYTVEVVPSDAAGLLSRETFRSATLHAATTSFESAEEPLPAFPNTTGVVFDHRMAYSSLAPEVVTKTTLHVTTLVEFVQNWRDMTFGDRTHHTLYIEMPNRHMSEPLHQLVIDPTIGGIVVEITGVPPY